MCDHAWNWAKEKGHWRCNPIHGDEEINVVLEDFFSHVTSEGSSLTQTGNFELEDQNHTYHIHKLHPGECI